MKGLGQKCAHHWPQDPGKLCPPPEELVRNLLCTSLGWRGGALVLSPTTQEVSWGRAGTLANTLIKGLRAFFNWCIYSGCAGSAAAGLSLVADSGAAPAAVSGLLFLLRVALGLTGSELQAQQINCAGPDALLHVGSSLTRDWTLVSCTGRAESWPPNHQGSCSIIWRCQPFATHCPHPSPKELSHPNHSRTPPSTERHTERGIVSSM